MRIGSLITTLLILVCTFTACAPPDVASTTSPTPPPITATPTPTRDLDNLTFSLIDMLEPDRLEFKGMPWWCDKDTMFEALGIPEEHFETTDTPPPDIFYKTKAYVEELECDATVLFKASTLKDDLIHFIAVHIYVDFVEEAEYEALKECFWAMADELSKTNPEMQVQVENTPNNNYYSYLIRDDTRRDLYIARMNEIENPDAIVMSEMLAMQREGPTDRRTRPGTEDNDLEMFILTIGFFWH